MKRTPLIFTSIDMLIKISIEDVIIDSEMTLSGIFAFPIEIEFLRTEKIVVYKHELRGNFS